jgi:hypothetical protein
MEPLRQDAADLAPHPVAERLHRYNCMEEHELDVHTECPTPAQGVTTVFFARTQNPAGLKVSLGGFESCRRGIPHSDESFLVSVAGKRCAQAGCPNVYKLDTKGKRGSDCFGHPFQSCWRHQLLCRKRPPNAWGAWKPVISKKKTGKPGKWNGLFHGGCALFEIDGQVHPFGTRIKRPRSVADHAEAVRLLEACVPANPPGTLRHHMCAPLFACSPPPLAM